MAMSTLEYVPLLAVKSKFPTACEPSARVAATYHVTGLFGLVVTTWPVAMERLTPPTKVVQVLGSQKPSVPVNGTDVLGGDSATKFGRICRRRKFPPIPPL